MKVRTTRRSTSLSAVGLVLLLAAQASAGVRVNVSNGIVMTGADGVTFAGTNGIVMTGADGLLAFQPNGIVMTGADGVTPVLTNGIVMTGADGLTYTGASSVGATHADGITMTGADGIVMTGADGIVMTGADGTTYVADSVEVRQPNGIVMTGADGINMTGADGIVMTGADGLSAETADGIVMTGADGINMTGADAVTATTPDGHTFTVAPNGIVMTGADNISVMAANGIVMTGADGIVMTGADSVSSGTGLQSMDPELAARLDTLADDSWINAAVVYHHLPTASDLDDLRSLGVAGGTRFHALPVIVLTATRAQLVAISHLPAVRSIYGNRTLQTLADTSRAATTGVDRAAADADLLARNGGVPYTGRGVTVAILDTGVDATHPDLAGRVSRNVRLADQQSAPAGFGYPANVEGVANTDPVAGHGTFVAGIVAGTGAASSGRYRGVAPDAAVVGLSAGDMALISVLAGFDYVLAHGPELGVRVVNCSFSAATVYDANDPVNVATKMLADAGVTVVVSAGNTGSGWDTLNPYAMAPWVIGVGATDSASRLADFSSRGGFGGARPALVAPGVSVVGPRGTTAPNVVGALGVEPGSGLAAEDLVSYTVASGTSFSAPQVAGTVALMLEANPSLTPAQVRDVLQRSATPLSSYFAHEVGAGMLNAHAAVLEAAYPQRRMGRFRATLGRGQVEFIRDPYVTFDGSVAPGVPHEAALQVPADTVRASVRIAWGGILSPNDLSLSLLDPTQVVAGSSNRLNIPGLTGRAERVSLDAPRAGTWRARVANTLGAGTAQAYTGALDVARVRYAPIRDLSSVSATSRDEIYHAIRSFTMHPFGVKFRPTAGVRRADLASSLVMAGRAPQYLPGVPSYQDVRDQTRMLWVESAQRAPGGPLIHDAQAGGQFRPESDATRLVAAVALVRAAGLRGEAESRAGAVLPVTDGASIPTELRGYVAIALERGLLVAEGGRFDAGAPLTRAALSHALVVLAGM